MKCIQLIPEHVFFALRFFLAPFFTLILAKTLFELLAFNFLDLNQVLIQQVSGVQEISGVIQTNEIKARLLWATSVMVYFFIMIGFGAFIWNLLKSSETKLTLLIFVIIASAISVVETSYLLNVESAESPIASIFRFTFDALSGSGLFTANQLFIVHTTLDIINLIGFLVVPFGIVAGCCIMHEIPLTSHKDAEYFLGRSVQLKKLITGGSAVMVIGVIHMQLWLNWPLAFLGGAEDIIQLKSITLLICQYWGVSYSLIIAALYVPSVSYLSNQAKLALQQGSDREQRKDPSKWLIENHMMFSPIASLPQILTVIAPMLVGTFGSTLSDLVFY